MNSLNNYNIFRTMYTPILKLELIITRPKNYNHYKKDKRLSAKSYRSCGKWSLNVNCLRPISTKRNFPRGFFQLISTWRNSADSIFYTPTKTKTNQFIYENRWQTRRTLILQLELFALSMLRRMNKLNSRLQNTERKCGYENCSWNDISRVTIFSSKIYVPLTQNTFL